jgi:hypothetical protein
MIKVNKTETVFLTYLIEILNLKSINIKKHDGNPSGMMKIMIFHIVLSFVISFSSDARNFITPEDTTHSTKKRISNLRLTTRIHSLGLFNYSGRVSSDNPAFDFNITYDRKTWGFMVFDVIDLYNQRSANNFALALLYKKIKLSNRLTITPNTGFAVEEWGKEKGDRQIVVTALRLNKKLTIDNSMLFANILLDRHNLDWVNRFRMIYAYDEHVDFTLSLWHNNKVFDTSDYVSYGFNVSYSRIKISDVTTLSTSVTALVMATTSDQEIFPKKNGMIFTIAATID